MKSPIGENIKRLLKKFSPFDSGYRNVSRRRVRPAEEHFRPWEGNRGRDPRGVTEDKSCDFRRLTVT